MRISGIGRFNKCLSKQIGNYKKQEFEIYITSSDMKLSQKKKYDFVDISIVTFVNSKSFTDLLLSIKSFLISVGEPKVWTLYLDDDFTENQLEIFNGYSFLKLVSWDYLVSNKISSKFSEQWQLRKFAVFSSHLVDGTTVFADSDIIYYPNFAKFLETFRYKNWYLPEPPESKNYDTTVKGIYEFNKQMYSVNAGFFILNDVLNWSVGFDYLNYAIDQKSKDYFLDQTALNLIFSKDLNAQILDPRIFHASANDHFALLPLDIEAFAIRHYVGLVRHKMWQLGWKKYFK